MRAKKFVGLSDAERNSKMKKVVNHTVDDLHNIWLGPRDPIMRLCKIALRQLRWAAKQGLGLDYYRSLFLAEVFLIDS